MGYDAFISYSHGADGRLAPALQTALHRFAKPWWKLRAANVFRDGTSLAAAHDLSGAIKTALADSRFFIFLASPHAAQSKWCQREVEYWVAERPLENFLIVLTEGSIAWADDARDFDWQVTDALPRSLSAVFKAEPLWLDLSWARTGEQVSANDPRFRQGVAMLAARLHNKSLDEIAGEDVRQHRRTRRIARAAVGALVALTVSSVIGAWYAVEGQRRAERNLEQALAATDTMVGDVAEGMRSFYGVPRNRLAALLGRVEAILDSLASMETSDALIERRATMLHILARTNVELGDLKRAAETRDKAELLIAPLMERDGPLSSAWRTMTSLQIDSFDIARGRSDYIEAQERAKLARAFNDATLEALTTNSPAAIRRQSLEERVRIREQQQIAAADQGRLDDAFTFGREAVEAADMLLATFSQDASALRLASAERAKRAQVLVELGQPDEALKDLDTARAKLIELERAEPNRLEILQALIEIETARGTIFEDRKDWLSAIVAYEICADVLAKLRGADAKNVALTFELAAIRSKLAHAATKLGDRNRAKSEFAAAGLLFSEALRAQPDNVSYVHVASLSLQREAALFEESKNLDGARERLDQAVTISDALVLQRGADRAGTLIGVSANVARARHANLWNDPKTAIRHLERAEILLADLGRPPGLADLSRALDLVGEIAQQWQAAGKIDRAASIIADAPGLYTPPQGVSEPARARYLLAIAKLQGRKAQIALTGGNTAVAVAAAERAVSLYESEIVPHSRSDSTLDGMARQLEALGRITAAAQHPVRSREAYCAIAPKLSAFAPDLARRPRLWQTALEGDFLCIEARYSGGEQTESEKQIELLAIRVDRQVPIDDELQGEWRSLRTRVATLRGEMRKAVGDADSAIKLYREAIAMATDATKFPTASADDVSRLAALRRDLASLVAAQTSSAEPRLVAQPQD